MLAQLTVTSVIMDPVMVVLRVVVSVVLCVSLSVVVYWFVTYFLNNNIKFFRNFNFLCKDILPPKKFDLIVE